MTGFFKVSRPAAAGTLLSTLLLAGAAWGHGALSGDADTCKLAVGPYFMHFTGYQPGASGNTEFCEDIPGTGQTIVVLESMDDALRDMEVQVQILESRPGVLDADQPAVLQRPFRSNARGSITVMHSFPAAGRFVGLVTVRRAGESYTARFPFSVGLPPAVPAEQSPMAMLPAPAWPVVVTATTVALAALMLAVIYSRRQCSRSTQTA
jgi:hypothetical protein